MTSLTEVTAAVTMIIEVCQLIVTKDVHSLLGSKVECMPNKNLLRAK